MRKTPIDFATVLSVSTTKWYWNDVVFLEDISFIPTLKFDSYRDDVNTINFQMNKEEPLFLEWTNKGMSKVVNKPMTD